MRLAQIQMAVTADKAENLRHAEALLASVKVADMAVLPEMFCCPYDNGCFRAYGEAAGGAAYQMLSRAAAETPVGGGRLHPGAGRRQGVQHQLCLFAGRTVRRPAPEDAPFRHRRGRRPAFRESDTLTAGDDVTVFDTPWANGALHLL